MVEIRVAVENVASVHTFARRLASVFDPSSVSLDEPGNEVTVRSEWESRTVVLVLSAVEAWLAEDGGSARLSIGDRSYTMFGPDHEQPAIADSERGIRHRVARRTGGPRTRSPAGLCLRAPVER